MVSAILAMAHALGHRVVAEGVETTEQLAFLRDHGCDQSQGYLIARPGGPEQVEAVLTENGGVPRLQPLVNDYAATGPGQGKHGSGPDRAEHLAM